MKWRRKRGTLLQELGKTIGGVLSVFGMYAYLKAAGFGDWSSRPGKPYDNRMYENVWIGGTGDLYTPFPLQHVNAIMVIGAVSVVVGCTLRCISYWKVAKSNEAVK